MKLIAPIPINDARFVSSTVAETDYAVWNAATNYAQGNKVIRTTGVHKVFERLIAGTTATAPEADPVNWLDLGATNRWAMFDQKVGTQTSATTSLTVTVAAGVITGLALVGVEAAMAQVTVTDPVEGVVFDRTISLPDSTGIDNWYSWFFDDVIRRDTAVLMDLPSYSQADVSVTLSDSEGSTVSLGALVLGRSYAFAEAARAGASVGIQDYSKKDTDDFGNVQIVQRAFSKRARWSFVLENTRLDAMQKTLASLRAVPAVYVGGRYDAPVMYGFYRDFDTVIAYASHSECSLELEGLI